MKTLRQFEMPEDKKTRDFFTKLFGAPPGEAGKWRDGGLTMADFTRVPSIEDCIGRIEKLGGRVVVPKKAVPGAGYFAVCLDTENRAFGLWEDLSRSA